RFVPYAEVGAGWDSNANASTGNANYGIFVLDPDNVATSSPFVELAGGFQHGYATEPGGAVLSSGRASYQFNPDAKFVNQALVSLGTLGQKSWGATRASVGASGYYGWLDGNQHELGAGVDLGLAQRLGMNWELASAGRAGVVRFQQDELEILDVNRYLGSLTLTRTALGAHNGRVGVAALFGTDDAQKSASPYSNDRLGARLFGGWQTGAGNSLNLEVAWLKTDYADSPGFTSEALSYVDREDDQWTVAVSTEYRNWPAPGYSLVPTLRYTNTNSTVSLYDYDRFEIGVYLRRSRR
ncbi:MAG: surface lipoprotein assembly modifier, partial [Gammaproteobacteria bacterium]